MVMKTKFQGNREGCAELTATLKATVLAQTKFKSEGLCTRCYGQGRNGRTSFFNLCSMLFDPFVDFLLKKKSHNQTTTRKEHTKNPTYSLFYAKDINSILVLKSVLYVLKLWPAQVQLHHCFVQAHLLLFLRPHLQVLSLTQVLFLFWHFLS